MEVVLEQNKRKSVAIATDFGLVSVIMPNYNSSPYLKQAISSVVAQSYQNWELILVDDRSTDDWRAVLESFNDDRIRVIENQENSGAAVSRNRAIEAANGRWIAFLDSDDRWCEDKLEKQLSFMVNGSHAFSFTHYCVVDQSGEGITDFCPKKRAYDYHTILKHCYIGCSTVIYDRDRLGKVYMPTNAPKREDFACWLYILKQGIDAVCLHECLTDYRIHSSSVSSNKWKMIGYQWTVYRRVERMNVLKCLFYMAHWAVLGVLKYR